MVVGSVISAMVDVNVFGLCLCKKRERDSSIITVCASSLDPALYASRLRPLSVLRPSFA